MKHIDKNTQLALAVILAIFILNLPLNAQERIKPAKVYQAGETIAAPMYGFLITLPDNWRGYLTRETAIFTLSCDTVNDVYLRVLATEESLKSVKSRWTKGVELSPGLLITTIGDVVNTETGLKTEFEFTDNPGVKGFAQVECGSYGHCYTAFITAPTPIYKKYQNALEVFADGIVFKEPWLEDYYGDHDWNAALAGKYVFNYDIAAGSRKTNQLWLCENGTFTTKIVRKKALKGVAGPYTGKQSGSYRIEGVGSTGVLVLAFQGLAPLSFDLLIKDDHIFINEQRFLTANHNKCK